ncbi:GatB/YqeY domain-containing protein [Candidatus Woesebacteria bacterium]|nr:GatB/YqeY domain-containing protein [Candidatus Woesebacteria bacterium]QQG47387.1 MAG: GatB/YqeY domain-containing protein [Candidatus Woesebacteria bacterium]
MISDTIQKQITDALKAKDETRLIALRMLSTALSYARIDKMSDLNEEEELTVVKKEAKKRKDAIEIYDKANQKERAEKERAELKILEEYLPKQMDDEQLSKIIDEVLSGMDDKSNMGRVIGEVMKKTRGQAEGKRVSELVKSKS